MTGWASFFHPYEVAWRWIPRDRTIRGEWWKPDHPESRVRGSLTIPRFGSPKLHFEGGDELLELSFGHFDILHGRIWDIGNSPATVFKSFATQGGTAYAPGTSERRHHRTVDITVNRLLVGRHLSSDTESAVTRVSLVSPYLHAWAQFDGFSDSPMAPDQPDYELKFTPQETEHVRVSESTSVQFRCVMHRAGAWLGPNKLDLTQHTAACLRFAEPLPLLQVEQDIETLMAFINFCLRRFVDEWDIFLEFEQDNAAPASDESKAQPGALLQAFSKFEGTGYSPALMMRRDLGADLSSCLQAWWSTFNEYRPAIAHHLTTLGNTIPYLNVRFLIAAQGLEAFHRRFQSGVYQSTSVYKKTLLKTLKAAVPTDFAKRYALSNDVAERYRAAVFGGLSHLNEYTFKDRIMEVYETHNDLVDFAFQNPEETIEKIKRLRNTLTHVLSKGDELYKSGESRTEMLDMTDRTRLLLEAAILARLTDNREMARGQLESIYWSLR